MRQLIQQPCRNSILSIQFRGVHLSALFPETLSKLAPQTEALNQSVCQTRLTLRSAAEVLLLKLPSVQSSVVPVCRCASKTRLTIRTLGQQ